MSPNRIITVILLVLVSISGCKNKETTGSIEGFSSNNSDFQEIINLQDKRATRELVALLSDSDPAKRYLAASAFASNLDTTAIPELLKLLKDPSEKIRAATAYSLGQLKSDKAVKPILKLFANEPSSVYNLLC